MKERIAVLLNKSNSADRGKRDSVPIKLHRMARRPLTSEEKLDSLRLQSIWLRQKNALGLTQERVAADCGWTTQGAFNQYLRGKIPLNLNAVAKLARVLNVNIAEISPRLAAEIVPGSLGLFENSQEAAGRDRAADKKGNGDRQAFLRLYDLLEKEGIADIALRLLEHLVNESQQAKRRSAKKNKTNS